MSHVVSETTSETDASLILKAPASASTSQSASLPSSEDRGPGQQDHLSPDKNHPGNATVTTTPDAADGADAAEAVDAGTTTADPTAQQDPAQPSQYDWRFYAIFGSLIAATLLSALDGAIVSTALPTIAETLDLGSNAVWVANVYFLTG